MDQADQSAGGREDGAGERIPPSLLDRRASERFTVLDHRGWLGWWGDRDFEIVDVTLLDLSRGGALFEMDTAPTAHQTAQLGLETLREDSCLTVKVVWIRRGRRKKYRVHAAFTQTCPDELYAAALHGPESRRGGVVPGPPVHSLDSRPDQTLRHA
jgi:hypothetical protein